MATSYFFTNTNALDSDNNHGFGPIDANSFRITSTFTIAEQCKAYAVTDGHLFIVPNAGDTTKINIVLKPSDSLFMGVKVKYLIYRGVKKSSFYKIVAGVDEVTGSTDPDAIPLLTQLWDDFNEFNSNDPNANFLASYIGVDPSITNDIAIIRKFFNQNSYNLPKVKAGQHIGFFNDTMGFEVVVDFGDYTQEIEESGLKIDIGYLKATECILNINGSNPANTAGNMPGSVTAKIFRENVFMFLDPAAFYGAHISRANLQRTTIAIRKNINSIKYFENAGDGNDHTAQLVMQIYKKIVDKFSTKNLLYLYILGKRGRSVDFYNPEDSTNTHSGVGNFLKTNQWPLKVFSADDHQGISFANRNLYVPNQASPIPENTIYYQISFDLTKDMEADSVFYLNDPFNGKKLIEETHVTTVGDTSYHTPKEFTSIIFDKPAYIENINGGIGNINSVNQERLILSSFMYAVYQQVDLQDNDDTYHDLFGPVDLDRVYEPNDYQSVNNLIETIVFKKLKITHFNNSKYINQMYTVFDDAGGTKLFVAYTVDSVSNDFVKSKQELVQEYTTTYDINRIFNINDALLGDSLRFWKAQKVVDDITVTTLRISGNGADYINLNKSFMMGITNIEFESLLNLNSDVKMNVYLELESLVLTDEGVYRAQVGIKYENNNGVISTAFPSSGSEIKVYSLNGLIFATDEFANHFSYGSQFAQTTVTFLPKDTWKGLPADDLYGIGEYGIDWMRTEPVTSENSYPFSQITGVQIGQTNSNQHSGLPFEFRPDLYNQLKNEVYDAISIPWATSPDDEYFSTWLRLGENEEAMLKLKIVINVVPQWLTIRYESNHYEVTVFNGGTVVGNRVNNTNQITDYILPGALFTAPSVSETYTIEIKRLSAIGINNVNRRFEVFAVETVGGQQQEKVAGMLKLFQEPERKLNVVIVNVTIRNPNMPAVSVPVTEVIYDRQRAYLTRYLRQAGITAQVPLYEKAPVLNVFGDHRFHPNGDYIVSGGVSNYIAGKVEGAASPGYVPIRDYLKSLLPSAIANPMPTVPHNTMLVYFINWKAKTKNAGTNTAVEDPNEFLGGFSSGANTDAIMFIDTLTDKITFAHETYHSLGLGHTFSSFEKFSFDPKKTDNIMDYTQMATLDYTSQPSTYYWQWLIARRNTESWERAF